MFVFDGNGGGIVDLRTSLQCIQGNNPRSISFMIQTTTTSCSRILSTGNQYRYQLFGFTIKCGLMLGVSIYNADYNPTTGKIINDGLWHTVLVTYDGTTLTIFVDGILENTAISWNSGDSTATIASTLNTIGNSGNYLGKFSDNDSLLSGKLKNVQFYDYVIPYAPSNAPTMIPSVNPTYIPSQVPTFIPTIISSKTPTLIPSNKPSVFPTMIPSYLPSLSPSIYPTIFPSVIPSVFPSNAPAMIYSSGKYT